MRGMNGDDGKTSTTNQVTTPPENGKKKNYKLPPSGSGGRKNWFEVPEISERYMAYQLLRSQGIPQEKAAEMIGYTASYSWTIERKIKEQRGQSGELSPFLTENRIKRAGGVVDKLMQGKKWGDIKEVKDSTALRAAETVLDRQFPKRSESGSPNISFVQINLGQYSVSAPLSHGALVVEAEMIGENDGGNPPLADSMGFEI